MAGIATGIRLNDQFTGVMYGIIESVQSAVNSMGDLQDVMNETVNTSPYEDIQSDIESTTRQQDEFNQSINRGSDEMDGLTRGILGVVGAYASLEGVKALVNLSDELTQTTARLNMIVDEGSDVSELFDKIYASAQDARVPIDHMADTVAKLELNTKGVFDSNDEAVQFAENLSKMFTIAGTEQASAAGATTQLIQALGSGVLRGEEFNSIFEAAPNIMHEIAESMGVPIGQLRSMAAEGQITADIVKNALLGATTEINEQFESMPMTWSQVWTGVMNQLYYASMPLLEVISLLAQNWSIIQPIVLGATAVLGIYLVAVHGVALATRAWAVAQSILNNIMAMNPIYRIAMIIILIISLIYAAIAAINKVTGSTINATGVITGVVYSLFSFLWNIVASFVNFFANVWTDPIGSIVRLFADLADNVLGMLELIARGIDAVFGSNLAGTVSGWRSSLSGMVTDTFGEGVDVMPMMDAMESFNKGYEFGEGLSDSVGEMFGGGAIANYSNLGDFSEVGSDVGDIASATGSIADTLEVTSEDLKYLRDLAETEVVNRFTTAEIRIEQTNNNNISSTMDLDGVVSGLTEAVNEAVDSIAEGVHD